MGLIIVFVSLEYHTGSGDLQLFANIFKRGEVFISYIVQVIIFWRKPAVIKGIIKRNTKRTAIWEYIYLYFNLLISDINISVNYTHMHYNFYRRDYIYIDTICLPKRYDKVANVIIRKDPGKTMHFPPNRLFMRKMYTCFAKKGKCNLKASMCFLLVIKYTLSHRLQ